MEVVNITDTIDVYEDELRTVLALLLEELQLELCRSKQTGNLFLNQIHKYE